MSSPSEPEKYSINEMMERLKNHPVEDPIEAGELVTRSDGSQAIRVRKRKRRSQQPHKEVRQHTRRARMIQVSVALILILLAVFGAGTAIVFANSTPFREKLLRNIATHSGAAVELEQFRMNPTSANASRLALTWPAGNVLRDLTLRTIRADISPASFLGKTLAGEELLAAEGSLTLRVPQPDQPTRAVPASAVIPPIRFKRYAIPKTQVLFGDPAAPLIRMQNSDGSFYPISVNDRAQLLLSRGDITIPGWPKLRMDRSHIEFRGSEVDIIGMRLRHETDNRGMFELTGTVSPYAADRASTLAIRLESYLLAGIAGPELGRLFSGRIDTAPAKESNCLAFTLVPEPHASFAIAFRNTPTSFFEISGFPFLFGLAQTLDDDWFERPVFENDVSGTLRRADGNVVMGDLNFENKERMAMRGAVTLTPDRRLAGKLEIGVADAMINPSTNRRLDAMFGPVLEGFRWLTLKISGTAAAPTDNFRDLYEAAGQTKKPDAPREIPTFEELTEPK